MSQTFTVSEICNTEWWRDLELCKWLPFPIRIP